MTEPPAHDQDPYAPRSADAETNPAPYPVRAHRGFGVASITLGGTALVTVALSMIPALSPAPREEELPSPQAGLLSTMEQGVMSRGVSVPGVILAVLVPILIVVGESVSFAERGGRSP